ncbi:SDR family oxidoreductase [Chelatococcus sp. GCM10030263]|uniref:SDR family oxidoreductase n=1 Tax=Chelatococcus sp. GCM10030263 TaxID=3273387 RepID=UPI00361FAEEA
MRSVVITGTSSGIGRATAHLAIRNGARVFGSVRRPEDGARLAAEFGERFVPLVFDVRDEAAVAAEADRVRAMLAGERLSGLVNNAGVGIAGPVLHQPADEIREQIETNLLSLFWVTRAFAPLLGTDRTLTGPPGRIVNMSSIGGKIGQPFAAAYVASKHGIEGFSEALRREMALYDIKVIIMGPALVDTPVWDKLARTIGRYAHTDYAAAFDRGVGMMVENGHRSGLPAESVAEAVWHALTTPRPRLRYSPARHPLIEQVGARSLPKRVLDWSMERFLGLKPERADTRSGGA